MFHACTCAVQLLAEAQHHFNFHPIVACARSLPNTNDPKFPQKMSTTMLAGLAPFWLVFMFVSWVRFRFTYNRALDAVR